MRISDLLLIAPMLFCIVGVLIGVFTDVALSRLWAAVAAASMAALALHWLLGRPPRPGRTRQPKAS